MRMTTLHRSSFAALVLVVVGAMAGTAPAAGQQPAEHAQHAEHTSLHNAAATVVLVRHGEKADEPEQDPPLTDAGHARARALLEALGGADVAAVYSTDYARTRDTAQPLADAAGVGVTVIADAQNFIPQVAERVRTQHAGDVVVIVGHSNTIGRTIAALGGANTGDLPDEAYDRFYILLVQEGVPTRVIRARYGVPTP